MNRSSRSRLRAPSHPKPNRPTGRRVSFEALENRRVLDASLVGGVLAIQGTNHKDVIQVTSDGSNLTVTIHGKSTAFAVADVQSIEIKGGNGNDTITLDQTVLVPATIEGGNGNDVIQGGAGNDTIFGGNGKDLIDGGAGTDQIHGGNGKDDLHGGDGDDQLFGENGKDVLNGDLGNDDLHGGNGPDQLFGGDGDDLLDGGRGPDLLDGGAGHDVFFFVRSNDTLVTDAEDNYQPDGFHTSPTETQLVLSLHSGNLLAKVTYDSQTNQGVTTRTFTVEVFGGTPGDTLDVSVGLDVLRHVTYPRDAAARDCARRFRGGASLHPPRREGHRAAVDRRSPGR